MHFLKFISLLLLTWIRLLHISGLGVGDLSVPPYSVRPAGGYRRGPFLNIQGLEGPFLDIQGLEGPFIDIQGLDGPFLDKQALEGPFKDKQALEGPFI